MGIFVAMLRTCKNKSYLKMMDNRWNKIVRNKMGVTWKIRHTYEQMGHIRNTGSHLEKWVTHEKNGSHLTKWVTLRKWVTVEKMGHTWKKKPNLGHLEMGSNWRNWIALGK